MLKNTLTTPEKQSSDQEPNAVAVSLSRSGNQNNLRNIGLIVEREYKNRLSQRSFKISTAVILILIILGSFVPTIVAYVSSITNSQTKVVVVNNAGTIAGMSNDALSHYINTTLNGVTPGQSTSGKPAYTINTAPTDSIESLQKQVKDGTLGILLVLERPSNQDVKFTYYTNADPIRDTNTAKVQGLASQLSLLDKASRLGLTPDQTSKLFSQPEFAVVNVGQSQNNRPVSDIVAGYILAYVGIILIFMSVYMYGVMVANGVAEEKGSRIMEILVNAATPFQLMAGKIIGIGAAGLTQMALFVIVGISALLVQNPIKAALLGNNSNGLNLNITGSSISLLLLLLVYFILGFLLYATLFAAMGALVKRQDEVQNAVQPLTWLFMVGYFVSFFGIYTPDATWVKVISYIPFWTPTTMLMRIGVGSATWWEIAITIVLMIVAIFLCALIAARIYRYGVLMYGQKPSMRQLFSIARMR
ncbi:MAG TPA: ABC transporter permease [Ktedonobacteraceae bacterium]|nr:ABC transporter permease [Ktedonobacteraceae bacterium]